MHRKEKNYKRYKNAKSTYTIPVRQVVINITHGMNPIYIRRPYVLKDNKFCMINLACNSNIKWCIPRVSKSIGCTLLNGYEIKAQQLCNQYNYPAFAINYDYNYDQSFMVSKFPVLGSGYTLEPILKKTCLRVLKTYSTQILYDFPFFSRDVHVGAVLKNYIRINYSNIRPLFYEGAIEDEESSDVGSIG